MATGRTTDKWIRMYCDGYDLSGYGREIGPLVWSFDSADLTAQMSDAAKGELPAGVNISPGVFNGVMQSTTDSGTEISVIQGAGTARDIMVPVGIRAAPAIGDPVWISKSSHNGFHVVEAGGAMTLNATFGAWDASDLVSHAIPWGVLIIPNSTLTGTTTTASVRSGAQVSTTQGGYMVYQIFAGSTGGWTIQIQDSTNDAAWASVEGATVTIADVSTPQAGIIETTLLTTQVDQYIRCVANEDSAGTLICAVAFVRG